jgi:hypothetical protein
MKQRRNVSILGPVLLIGVGILLLLNILGILEWSVWWNLLRFWPILLIAAGLDLLIGRRSLLGALIATVLVLALLAGALWLATTGAMTSDLPSEQIRQSLGSATQAEVTIEPAVGILRLEALPESANLVEGTVYLGDGEELDQDFSTQGAKARYRLGVTGAPWTPFTFGWNEERVWDLGLSPGAALQLKASLGAGQSEIDLTGLDLSDLEIDMGVGQNTVILPAQGRFEVRIDGAVGVTEIVIPSGMAVRLQADTGLAGRQLPAEFREASDGMYTSPGYAAADNRVDLYANQAVGLLRIRTSE